MAKETKGIPAHVVKVQGYERAILHCEYQFMDDDCPDIQTAEISVTISFPFNLQCKVSDIANEIYMVTGRRTQPSTIAVLGIIQCPGI